MKTYKRSKANKPWNTLVSNVLIALFDKFLQKTICKKQRI